ncbi:MAG: hypothetical protein HY293_19385 [Planctomycetes bacterium]|nr:hypothetical protein [Planctomycetota bacterium]
MKTPTVLLAALLSTAAGCQEPPRVGQMDELVTSLAHLQKWDAAMQGRGHYAYDAVMGYGPEIYPILVAHLTDETPTAIYEDVTQRNPKVSDVAKWDRTAKFKVQAKFRLLLDVEESNK